MSDILAFPAPQKRIKVVVRPFGAVPVWCLRNNYTFAAMDFGRRLLAPYRSTAGPLPSGICLAVLGGDAY